MNNQVSSNVCRTTLTWTNTLSSTAGRSGSGRELEGLGALEFQGPLGPLEPLRSQGEEEQVEGQPRECQAPPGPVLGLGNTLLQTGEIDGLVQDCGNSSTLNDTPVDEYQYPGIGIPIIKIRRSWDRLIFIYGIPILAVLLQSTVRLQTAEIDGLVYDW